MNVAVPAQRRPAVAQASLATPSADPAPLPCPADRAPPLAGPAAALPPTGHLEDAAAVLVDAPLLTRPADPRRLTPVQPRTMVEQAAESIVAAAARGVFLPGDRLVEAEIARDLGISRVPVREALRLLESHGIVVSTPYKGMRLMQVTNRDVGALMRLRLRLEILAAEEAAAALRQEEQGAARQRIAPLQRAAAAFALAAERRDETALVAANLAFHGELVRASGNAPLYALWQSLARQLAVIWGLGHPNRDVPAAVREHQEILAAIESQDLAALPALMGTHIARGMVGDFEALLASRRAALC
jgi:DNA-binding GntR family transcriptional regulator